MEFKQLRQFVTLSETLNFRVAADRLHMTQPPLSVSIRKLEEEIGCPLFDRSTQGVALTPAGQAALPDARRALFHATEAMRVARATRHGLAGRLRVGFVGSAKYALLPRVLPAFRALHPEVVLELREASNGEIVHQLEASRFDIGFIRVPLANASVVRHHVVEHDRFVVALPAGHRLAGDETVTVESLVDEPFVHYAAHEVPGLHALSMRVFQDIGRVPHAAQEAVQVDTVVCLVASHLGVALVPSVAAHGRDGRVVFRELAPPVPSAAIGLAVAYNPVHENAAARRFRDLAAKASGTTAGLEGPA